MSLRHRHGSNATLSLRHENDGLFAPNRILTNAEQELVLEKLSSDYRTSTVFIRILGFLHFVLACLYVILALLGITFTSSTHYNSHHNKGAVNTNNNAGTTLQKNHLKEGAMLPAWQTTMSYLSRVILLLSSLVLASCGVSIMCSSNSLRFCKDHDVRNKVKKSRSANSKMSLRSREYWRTRITQICRTNTIHFYAMLLTTVFTFYWLLLWWLETHWTAPSQYKQPHRQAKEEKNELNVKILLGLCYFVQFLLVFWQPVFHFIVYWVIKSTNSAQTSLANLSRKTYNYDKW